MLYSSEKHFDILGVSMQMNCQVRLFSAHCIRLLLFDKIISRGASNSSIQSWYCCSGW